MIAPWTLGLQIEHPQGLDNGSAAGMLDPGERYRAVADATRMRWVDGQSFVVVNPLGQARREVIALPWVPSDRWSPRLMDGSGNELEVQGVPTPTSLTALMLHGCFDVGRAQALHGSGAWTSRCTALLEWELHVVVPVPPFGQTVLHLDSMPRRRPAQGAAPSDLPWWDAALGAASGSTLQVVSDRDPANGARWQLDGAGVRVWGRAGDVLGVQHSQSTPQRLWVEALWHQSSYSGAYLFRAELGTGFTDALAMGVLSGVVAAFLIFHIGALASRRARLASSLANEYGSANVAQPRWSAYVKMGRSSAVVPPWLPNAATALLGITAGGLIVSLSLGTLGLSLAGSAFVNLWVGTSAAVIVGGLTLALVQRRPAALWIAVGAVVIVLLAPVPYVASLFWLPWFQGMPVRTSVGGLSAPAHTAIFRGPVVEVRTRARWHAPPLSPPLLLHPRRGGGGPGRAQTGFIDRASRHPSARRIRDFPR